MINDLKLLNYILDFIIGLSDFIDINSLKYRDLWIALFDLFDDIASLILKKFER